MYVGVFLHVRLLMEAFTTELARIRTRVRVDKQVRGERRRAFETLAALHTSERASASSGDRSRASTTSFALARPLSPPS